MKKHRLYNPGLGPGEKNRWFYYLMVGIVLFIVLCALLASAGCAPIDSKPADITLDRMYIVHDQLYVSDEKIADGIAIYIDRFYDHCVETFGYGLPEQGGKFNQWYTVAGGLAVKHEGEISLNADGYTYSEAGWSIPIR